MSLAEDRDEITKALDDGGIKALPYTSEDITPPCAAVVPSQPYLRRESGTAGAVFGTMRVGFDVLLLSPLLEAKKTADVMDDLISDAFAALGEFDIREVSQPAEIQLSGSKYLGAVITIEHDTKEP